MFANLLDESRMPVLDPATSPVLSPATAPKKPSVFEDLVDVYYAPSQVFDRRREGEFGAALLIFMVLGAGLIALFWNALEPAFSAEASRQVEAMIAKNPRLPAEAVGKMRERAGHPSMAINVASIFVMTGVIALGGAVMLWFASKLTDLKVTFAQAMTASTYALAPAILNWVALGAVGLLAPPEHVTGLGSMMLGPTRFLERGAVSEPLYQFAQRCDLFTLWGVVIGGIGLAVMGGRSTGRGIAASAIAWAFGTALVVAIGALIGG
jgi:hypothetical protein